MTYSKSNMFKVLRALCVEGYITNAKLGVYVDMMIMDMMAQEGIPNYEFERVRSELFEAAENGELD